MGSQPSTRTHTVWLGMGLLLILAARILGSVAPDIEKLFNNWQRGAWHLYSGYDILLLAYNLVWFGAILLLVWMGKSYISVCVDRGVLIMEDLPAYFTKEAIEYWLNKAIQPPEPLTDKDILLERR